MPGMAGAPMSDLHTHPQCTSCGAVLATDNRAGLCELCTPTAQVTPDAAPVLSADFWEQPEIRSALLSRHFGRFLRVYRTAQSPQVKQTQLALWLGITQGQLSRIERSTTPLHDLHKLDTWARALHVPADRRWFSPSPTPTSSGVNAEAPDRATVEKSLHNEGSDVRRRDLLKVTGVTAAAAGTAGLLANTPWQRLMDSVDKGRPVDAATAQLMHDRTADFFDTEETVPARQILESLTHHRATLVALLPNARTDAVRNQLAVSLGETDALAGWLHFDLGCANEAANAWRSTLKVAKETGDGALAACALGYWSYLAAFRNDVAPAVRLLQQAHEYVPGSSAPATRSWISARQAEELGRLGDETGALRALERAFTAFDFARPRTERNWTAFFTSNRLGGLTVSTYMALNHPDATAAADSLLTSLPPTDNKARAYALADLTTLAVRNKDFDRADSLVGDAIEVTIRTENSIARQRLLTLASTLTTTPDRNTTGALRDQIISSLRR
jgi:transcriptional regulator with XRE-family HTH domain